MATQASSLSGALEIYNLRYQDALARNSKREAERFLSNINQINAYYDIICASLGEANNQRAQDATDAIIDILLAEGIVVSAPTTFITSVSVSTVPGSILVPTDPDGTDPNYTNAFADIIIYQYNVDQTSSWTITVQTETNVTVSLTDNRLSVTSITTDYGLVALTCSKLGFSDLDIEIPIRKNRQSVPIGGQSGQVAAKSSAVDYEVEWVEGIRINTNQIWTDYDSVYGSATGIRFGSGSSGIYETVDNYMIISTNFLITTGLVNGRDMVADGEKLDNIESIIVAPGTFNQVWLTGEPDTLPTFYKALANDTGTVATLILSQTVGDDQKLYLSNDHLGFIRTSPTTIYKGLYESVIEVIIDNNAAEQRVCMEIYLADASGVVIDSGILTEPVGDLGVRPIACLKTSNLTLTPSITHFVQLYGNLTEDVIVDTNERIRSHIAVQKIGAGGGSIQFDLYFGSDHQSFIKVPVAILLADLKDVDILGSATGDILVRASDSFWRKSNSISVGTNSITISPGGSVGATTGLWFGDGDTGIYEATDDEINFRFNGTDYFNIKTGRFQSFYGYANILSGAPSGTTANIRTFANYNTGIGGIDADTLSLITNATESVRIEANKLTISPDGSVGVTTGLWFGDSDTGLYEYADDWLFFRILGGNRCSFSQYNFASNYSGNYVLRFDGSLALPTYSFGSDPNTGIHSGFADTVSLIAGGIEGLRVADTYSIITGNFYPSVTATYSLGITTNRFTTLYANDIDALTQCNLIVDSVNALSLTTDLGTFAGGIKISNTTGTDDGTIRYTGTNYEVRISGAWESLLVDPVWIDGGVTYVDLNIASRSARVIGDGLGFVSSYNGTIDNGKLYSNSLGGILSLRNSAGTLQTNLDSNGSSYILGNLGINTSTITQALTVSGNTVISGQGHGGTFTATFANPLTFSANNGNIQQVAVTADTTIEITLELPGTFIFILNISTATPPTITIGTSFGLPFDNTPALINADGDSNVITLIVFPDGTKRYTANTITA